MRLLRIQHFYGFYYVTEEDLKFFKRNMLAFLHKDICGKNHLFLVTLHGLNFTFSIIPFTSFTQQITWLDALIADECEYNNIE